ncbi:MAG: META domain-containing protein [Pseudomonadota bacterium]
MKIGPLAAALALLAFAPVLAACTQPAPTQSEASGGHMLSAEDAWTRLTTTPWQLERIGEQPVLEGSKVTMTFGRDGRVAGNGGVNGYFGSAERIGAAGLKFSPIGATQMYGADPPGVMEQEHAYFQALQSADSYRIKDGGLQLMSGGTPVLAFQPEGA